MQNAPVLDRRDFLKAAGTGFLSFLALSSREAIAKTDAVIASAALNRSGGYNLLLFDGSATMLGSIALPARGHAAVFLHDRAAGVVFARRPGNFAVAFDMTNPSKPLAFLTPKGRHFYGHGAYSRDGKLLYAAENDFENADGKIGVYDTTAEYKHVHEFSSFGVGPHEIVMHPNGKILIVANGGIETHPDFGRAKLNLATMRPNLSFIDVTSGHLIEQHELPPEFHKLSIRHLDISFDGRVVFGCQNQDQSGKFANLVGSVRIGEEMAMWQVPENLLPGFANYVGSVALSADGQMVCATLPKADNLAMFETDTGKLIDLRRSTSCFGASAYNSEFVITESTGRIYSTSLEIEVGLDGYLLDNHSSVFQPV